VKHALLLLLVVITAVPCAHAVAKDKPAVAVIGTGTLASALGPAMGRHGYRVIYGSREPAREAVLALVKRTGPDASVKMQAEAAAQAQIVILAVPGEVVEEVAGKLGELDGTIIIDVSGGEKRVAQDGYLELVSKSSRAERIQSKHPGMRVVRINLPSIVFFTDPLLVGTRPTVLIAGNDPRAREAAATLMYDLGVDPWDAGPLRFAQVFDALNVMNLVPAQQGRMEGYELKLMPSMPFSCFFDMAEFFGFGKPYDLEQLPKFPRRDAVVSCDEWHRRLEAGEKRRR
jgi:predicted dinucleotide-binding enzyme